MSETTNPRLVRDRLLSWYDRNRRDLPWRRTRDPYAIWVSEVMLQQTQVKTVLGRYEDFLGRFPTLRALARARESDVLHAWQGLGYYSRARRLMSAARAIVERHDGRMPADRDSLLSLPGVGEYSAGAVASIAFGKRVPVVDGNVIRVLTRLFALAGDPGRAPLKARLWKLAGELVSPERPGDFNQSLMELGATVCTPREPACERCPLARQCLGRKRGKAASLPELPARAPVTEVHVAAAIVQRGKRVLVARVPDDAPRWAGLWVFPNVEVAPNERAERAAERAIVEHGARARVGAKLVTLRYTITRFRMRLEAFEATTKTRGQARFVDMDALGELAMPSPHRRLARFLEGAR
jgi:A/G-specific adenine glycosylase